MEKIITLEKQPADIRQRTGLVAYIEDIYEEYRNSEYRTKKMEAIEEDRKRYMLELPSKDFPFEGCSNKTLGLERIAVDSILPRLMMQLIPDTEKFIVAKPEGPEDIANVEHVEHAAHWMLTDSMKLKKKLRPAMEDLLIDGLVDVIPVWKEGTEILGIRKTVPVFEFQGQKIPIDPQILQDPAKTIQLIQMGVRPAGEEDITEEKPHHWFLCDLQIIPLSSCFYPDNWNDGTWGDQPYLRYIYPSLYDLKEQSEENGGPYFDIDETLVVDPERLNVDEEDPEQEIRGVKFSQYSKEIRLLESYVKWKNEWILVTYAIDSNWREVRRQKLSEIYPHGRKPVHRFFIFNGDGLPRMVRHYSNGADDLYNMMIDASMIEIVDRGFIEEGFGASLSDDIFELKLGQFPCIPKGSTVHWKPKGGVQATVFISFIQMLMGYYERMTSIMDSVLPGNIGGMRGQGTSTLGGMQIISAESNMKHRFMADGVRDTLEELVSDCIGMYAMYMPLDTKRRIWENNQWIFKPFDMAAIQGKYDYSIEISDATANPVVARQEAIQLFQMLGQAPVVELPKLVEGLLKSFDVKNYEEYIAPLFGQLMKALKEIPGLSQALPQMIQQFAKQQEQQKKQQEMIQSVTESEKRRQMKQQLQDRNAPQDMERQAAKNIMRQDAQRKAETRAGTENRKIVDQVTESTKREIFKPLIEQAAIKRLLG
jgi:hypothetical protein